MSDFEQVNRTAEWLGAMAPDERDKTFKRLRTLSVAHAAPGEEEADPVSCLGDFLQRPIDKPPIIVEPDLIAKSAVHSLSSRGGKGKTTFSLNRIVRWSMGKPLFDKLPEACVPHEGKPLKSLIVENDGSPPVFRRTIERILASQQLSPEETELVYQNILIYGEGGWPRLRIYKGGKASVDYENIRMALDRWKPDILFMEPLRSLWQGDENSNTEMSDLTDLLIRLAQEYEVAVLISHHEKKYGPEENGEGMDASRGATVGEGEWSVMERWAQINDSENISELTCTKNRFGDKPSPIRMRYMGGEALSYQLQTDDAMRSRVLSIMRDLGGGMPTAGEVAGQMGEKRVGPVRSALDELHKDETSPIQKVPPGRSDAGGSTGWRYRLVDSDTEVDF